MTPLTRFLRPFVVWATDLTDKYRSDPFFRVHIQIALLQVVLTGVIVIFLVGTYEYLSVTATHVLQTQLVISNGDVSAPNVIRVLADRRRALFILIFLVFLILTSVFSIVVANIGLKPARNSLKFQKRFISDISHEIRTPLAILKTSAEVALFEPSLSLPIRKIFTESIGELDRISETINSLLSLDSLIQPRAMRFDVVNLGTVAETVIARHSELARSRGITLSLESQNDALVHGNARAIEQVITNLIKNALIYTPKDTHGRVSVRIERVPNGGAAISIEDTGIGIAEKDLYHIFEPFYRADTSRARGIGTGAAGLGLAIVNEIVRLHRGTITLRSAPKRGTTIKIAFPAPKHRPPEPAVLAPSGSPHEATLDFS
jgi:signal transduction histidine kinase